MEYNSKRGRGVYRTSNQQTREERVDNGTGSFRGRGANNSTSGRGRGSTQRGGSGNSGARQSKVLDQRTITITNPNEDVNPRELTCLIKQCMTFTDLKSLYTGQQKKPYFNYIHACACFSHAIQLFTQFEGHKNISKEELTAFKDSLFIYSKFFDGRSFANIANDAIKLLNYSQKNQLKGGEALAVNVLGSVFTEIKTRNDLKDYKPQELSNLANAIAKLLEYGQKKPLQCGEEALAVNVLGSVFTEITIRDGLEDFQPQALSNVANAAVKLLDYGQKKPLKCGEEASAVNVLGSVFTEITIRDRLKDFQPQALSNVANAAVKLLDYGQKKPLKCGEEALAINVLGSVFTEIKNRNDLKDFKPQALSNLANDAAKLLDHGQKKPLKCGEEALAVNVLGSVFTEITIRDGLKDFKPQALSNVANAAVKLLDYGQKKPLKCVEEALAINVLGSVFTEITIRDRLEDFKSQALSNVANAAVKLLDYGQKKPLKCGEEGLAMNVLGSVFKEITIRDNLKDFEPQHLANIANDVVKAGFWNDLASLLLIKIGHNICNQNFDTFDTQAKCNLAWAFSVGKQLPLIYNWLIQGLPKFDEQKLDELTMEGSQQLYMAFLRKALDDRKWSQKNPDAFLSSYLPKGLEQKILREVNEESSKKDIKISKFQKSVRSLLGKILPKEYSIEEEYYIKPYPVDLAILRNKQLIAIIEVNGPTHFMIDGNYNPIHKFKEQLLKDMGYSLIINIDHEDWDKSDDQETLLKQKLEKVFKSHRAVEEELLTSFDGQKDTVISTLTDQSHQRGKSDNPIISAEITENGYQEVKTEGKALLLNVVEQKLNIQLQSIKSKPVIEKTLRDSIIAYATSMPAMALYLMLLLLTFNTIKLWNTQNS